MKNAEFKEAVKVALSDADLTNESNQSDVFMGFGLSDFKAVHVTIKQVAELIRWQAVQLNGCLDNEALEEVKNCGRQRFIIVG